MRGLPAKLALAALFALAMTSCHGSSHGGGVVGKIDGGPDSKSCGDGGARKTNGTACGCDADCTSGFCVDGVCCNSACTETCKSCNTPSAPGVCSFVAERRRAERRQRLPAEPRLVLWARRHLRRQGGLPHV